jgi:hypothetical protein
VRVNKTPGATVAVPMKLDRMSLRVTPVALSTLFVRPGAELVPSAGKGPPVSAGSVTQALPPPLLVDEVDDVDVELVEDALLALVLDVDELVEPPPLEDDPSPQPTIRPTVPAEPSKTSARRLII